MLLYSTDFSGYERCFLYIKAGKVDFVDMAPVFGDNKNRTAEEWQSG